MFSSSELSMIPNFDSSEIEKQTYEYNFNKSIAQAKESPLKVKTFFTDLMKLFPSDQWTTLANENVNKFLTVIESYANTYLTFVPVIITTKKLNEFDMDNKIQYFLQFSADKITDLNECIKNFKDLSHSVNTIQETLLKMHEINQNYCDQYQVFLSQCKIYELISVIEILHSEIKSIPQPSDQAKIDLLSKLNIDMNVLLEYSSNLHNLYLTITHSDSPESYQKKIDFYNKIMSKYNSLLNETRNIITIAIQQKQWQQQLSHSRQTPSNPQTNSINVTSTVPVSSQPLRQKQQTNLFKPLNTISNVIVTSQQPISLARQMSGKK